MLSHLEFTVIGFLENRQSTTFVEESSPNKAVLNQCIAFRKFQTYENYLTNKFEYFKIP